MAALQPSIDTLISTLSQEIEATAGENADLGKELLISVQKRLEQTCQESVTFWVTNRELLEGLLPDLRETVATRTAVDIKMDLIHMWETIKPTETTGNSIGMDDRRITWLAQNVALVIAGRSSPII